MKNHWVVNRETVWGTWHILLPPQISAESYLEFSFQLHEILYATNLWRPYHPENTEFTIQIFTDVMNAHQEHYGNIDMLPYLHYPIQVSYFDLDSAIESKYVTDIGFILDQMRSESPSRYNLKHADCDAEPPLELRGHFYRPENTKMNYVLGVHLRSDIWYPKVRGYLDIKNYENQTDMFDNYDLASEHTPRLNNFLNKLYELSKQYGGHWDLVDSEFVLEPYQPYIWEKGIKLTLDEQ